MPDFKCISPKQITIYVASKNNGFGNEIVIQIPRIKQPIPLFTLFRALGVDSDKNICKYILLDVDDTNNKALLYALRGSMVEASNHIDYEKALNYIVSHAAYTPLNMDKEMGIRKKREFTEEVLNSDLFPHCKTKEQKIYFLGYMTNRLLRCSLGCHVVCHCQLHKTPVHVLPPHNWCTPCVV